MASPKTTAFDTQADDWFNPAVESIPSSQPTSKGPVDEIDPLDELNNSGMDDSEPCPDFSASSLSLNSPDSALQGTTPISPRNSSCHFFSFPKPSMQTFAEWKASKPKARLSINSKSANDARQRSTATPANKGMSNGEHESKNSQGPPSRSPSPLWYEAEEVKSPESPILSPGSEYCDYNLPVEGKGPFWTNRPQVEEFTASCPVNPVAGHSLADELKRAKSRIWELELKQSRDAWKLHFEVERNKEVDAMNEIVDRLMKKIDDLQDAKWAAQRDVLSAVEHIREVESMRANESVMMLRAQMRIETLKEERDACVCASKRKLATGLVALPGASVVDDYAKKRRA